MTKAKIYVCVGEKCDRGFRTGFCGDEHTLEEWVDVLFGEKGKAYFAGAPDNEIIDYIMRITGKRLEIKIGG